MDGISWHHFQGIRSSYESLDMCKKASWQAVQIEGESLDHRAPDFKGRFQFLGLERFEQLIPASIWLITWLSRACGICIYSMVHIYIYNLYIYIHYIYIYIIYATYITIVFIFLKTNKLNSGPSPCSPLLEKRDQVPPIQACLDLAEVTPKWWRLTAVHPSRCGSFRTGGARPLGILSRFWSSGSHWHLQQMTNVNGGFINSDCWGSYPQNIDFHPLCAALWPWLMQQIVVDSDTWHPITVYVYMMPITIYIYIHNIHYISIHMYITIHR